MSNWNKWVSGGMLIMMFGLTIFSALTYQAALRNRLAIAALVGRVDVKTEDRYTAANAATDFNSIRELIEADRKDLTAAVKTRDNKFELLHKRLDAIEKKLKTSEN